MEKNTNKICTTQVFDEALFAFINALFLKTASLHNFKDLLHANFH